MNQDEIDARRSLDWATVWADNCERRFGAHLCAGCIEQRRPRCALADFARRLVADRYGAAAGRDSGSQSERRASVDR